MQEACRVMPAVSKNKAEKCCATRLHRSHQIQGDARHIPGSSTTALYSERLQTSAPVPIQQRERRRTKLNSNSKVTMGAWSFLINPDNPCRAETAAKISITFQYGLLVVGTRSRSTGAHKRKLLLLQNRDKIRPTRDRKTSHRLHSTPPASHHFTPLLSSWPSKRTTAKILPRKSIRV